MRDPPTQINTICEPNVGSRSTQNLNTELHCAAMLKSELVMFLKEKKHKIHIFHL